MELNVEIGQKIKCKKDGIHDEVVDYKMSDSHDEGHTVCMKVYARTEQGNTSNQWYNIKNFSKMYEI